MAWAGLTVEVSIDGERVQIEAGTSVLDACDAAGRYVPRLCHYPGLPHWSTERSEDGRPLRNECGLCVVRLRDGSEVRACATVTAPGMQITTDDPGLRSSRLHRLAVILAGHPHVCLGCPDRDGCSRDECLYGNPAESRCCAESGRCELGRVAAFVDAFGSLPRRAVTTSRDGVTEGRIRREVGLCIGCGRCVRVCGTAPEAGRALEMAPAKREELGAPGDARSTRTPEAPRLVARPKQGTLRASGCTFCGLCVFACPAGALTAPGPAGARWLAGRRERSAPAVPVLPPEGREAFAKREVESLPDRPGVVRLLDGMGQVFRITGAANVRHALTEALADPACSRVAYFQVEFAGLYTQRESELLALHIHEKGHLPPGNEVDDDLFGDCDH